MPFVDLNSISSKVSAFIKSDEGKKMQQDKIKEYIANGTKVTAAGSYVLTAERMKDIADQLRLEIQSTARRYYMSGDIPEDILDLFNELYHSDPHNIGDIKGISGAQFYEIELSFETDLYRPSLEPSKWDGVDNIIKLFDEGYSTGSYTVGYGRTVTGGTFQKTRQKQVRGYWPKADKIVWSVPYRKHLGFMQEAIDAFNERYEGVAKATLVW